jgi:hypothetical protein
MVGETTRHRVLGAFIVGVNFFEFGVLRPVEYD